MVYINVAGRYGTMDTRSSIHVLLQNGELVAGHPEGELCALGVGHQHVEPHLISGTFIFDGMPPIPPDTTCTDQLGPECFPNLQHPGSQTPWIVQQRALTAADQGDVDAEKTTPENVPGARSVAPQATSFFPVKSGRKIVLVKVEDIDWIAAARNYVHLHAGQESHLMRVTLDAIEIRLPAGQFARISRSSIVRLDRLKGLELLASRDCRLTLRNGTKLKMSRRYRTNFETLGVL